MYVCNLNICIYVCLYVSTQFTCAPGTKVQIRTYMYAYISTLQRGTAPQLCVESAHFNYVTGTQVQFCLESAQQACDRVHITCICIRQCL